MKLKEYLEPAEGFFERLNKDNQTSSCIRIPLLILSNWSFQGIFYMDRTEKLFKMGLELAGVIALFLILCQIANPVDSLVLAFLITHTANWILNGQIYGLFKKFGVVHTSADVLERTSRRIAESAAKNASIEMVLEYGSCARGEVSTESDIDLRVLRCHGMLNGLRACRFALGQRALAFLHKIPLDIYIFDSKRSIARMRCDESPRVLYMKDPRQVMSDVEASSSE